MKCLTLVEIVQIGQKSDVRILVEFWLNFGRFFFPIFFSDCYRSYADPTKFGMSDFRLNCQNSDKIRIQFGQNLNKIWIQFDQNSDTIWSKFRHNLDKIHTQFGQIHAQFGQNSDKI